MQVRDTLLLAVNSPASRESLRKMFEEHYNILEAENGEQTLMLLDQNHACIAIVLLELEMPGKSGFDALAGIERRGLLPTIPVLAIIDNESVHSERQALELGAFDIIRRPFHPTIVKNRVNNVIGLYHNKWYLEKRVEEQSAVLRHSNEVMVDALSSIIECRSVESGQHILRIRRFTEILLREIAHSCPEYGLTPRSIQSIASAAALHDIGKISIPDAILNKPGRLTEEEFRIMQTHSAAGSDILEHLSGMGNEEYLRYAYNICRYHHERWDGSGYPDGLVGDNIPICAQAVGLADAYDALTTVRVYKPSYSCREATNMILNGECGVFSPKLLECFKHVRGDFEELARSYADGRSPRDDAISAPLPPPGQTTSNSLQVALAKYQTLLHHLDATVVEMDLDQDIYHVIYNPNPIFAPLLDSSSFAFALHQLAQKSLHPEDQAMITEQLHDYLDDFFASGLRKRIRRYRLLDRDGVYRYYDATILRIDVGNNSRRALCIWSRSADSQSRNAAEANADPSLSGLLGVVQHCIYDRWLTMENVSKDLVSLLDYSSAEIRQQFHSRLMELILPEKREAVRMQVREQFATGIQCEVLMPMRHKAGHTVWVVGKGVLGRGQDGVERIHGMFLDLSYTRKTQEGLRQALERQELITEQSSDIIFEWDFDTDKLTCSHKWEERFGYPSISENASVAIPTASHFHPDDIGDIMDKFRQIREGLRFAEATVRIASASGRYLWNRIRVTSQWDDEGRPINAVGVIIDLDSELRATHALKDSADRDSLTGLLNKSAARRRIDSQLAESVHDTLSALAIIDLDNFKEVNDRYGHMFGDTVLTQVSAEISSMFRDNDVVARIGGDEFLVFMADIPNRDPVMTRCEKLIDTIQTLYLEHLADCSLSCSVGVAFVPEHGNAYQELFQRADRALYQAKDRGKGCCVFYSPHAELPLQRTAGRTRIDSDEQPGMANNSLVHYVFSRLYESGDVEGTINDALAMVGRQLNVSRIYIFENNADNTTCSNTFEWCNEGIAPEIDSLQNISYAEDIPSFQENFNERDIFYCPDVSALKRDLRDILEPQGIKSLLHCAIRDNGVFRGYVGFDECSTIRLWTQDQINLLTFLAQTLSVFLLKKRVQDQTNTLVEDLRRVLDNQYAWVYVVEPETFRLRFINDRTLKAAPEAETGMPCHKALMGNDHPCKACPIRCNGGTGGSCVVDNRHLNLRVRASAEPIHWDGEKAWLITCRDAAET